MPDGNCARRTRAFGVLTAATALAAALAGCSDEPTAANAPAPNLPLVNLAVHDTTIVAGKSSSYLQRIPGNGPVNLIGRSGNYVAMSLIQFSTAYFPARDTALVFSANLSLRFETWMGDSAGQFAFNVYRISVPWSEATATWDTVQAPGFYEQYVTRGSYTGGAGKDTQSVTIPLDTAMVRQWLATPTSTDNARYGIILVPASGCSIIRGFNEYGYPVDSTGWYPTLTIIAGSPGGTPRDTATYNILFDTFVGNVENLATNPQLIYVQSGVDYRSTLSFDVSFIPRGAVINSATLLLTNDPTTSRLSRFISDSTFLLATTLSPSDRTLQDLYSVSGRRRAGTLLTWAVDMSRPVQIWNRGSNYGVTLKPNVFHEQASFELLTFFNEQAAPSLRPRLTIKYSVVR